MTVYDFYGMSHHRTILLDINGSRLEINELVVGEKMGKTLRMLFFLFLFLSLCFLFREPSFKEKNQTVQNAYD